MSGKALKLFTSLLAACWLAGCAGSGVGYSITEQDLNNRLLDTVGLEQSVGVENVMFAKLEVDDLQVKIGRADEDRVSVFANTNAEVQMLSFSNMGLDLDIEFSAIPEYDQETGEVFLKSLRLEQLEENSGKLTPQITKLLEPAVALIGQALSTQPVYTLDSNKIQDALLKSAKPKLVIRDNKLVIGLLD